jgi:purine-nucleoside phosphorylase
MRHNIYRIRLQEAADYLSRKVPKMPSVGIILGSGLGEFGTQIEEPLVINANDIPNYPQSSVASHAGELIFGRVRSENGISISVLAFKGRVHHYENNDLNILLFPIALAHTLGIKNIILTNAAGGINPNFSPGDLMLLEDYLDLTFLPLYQVVASYLSPLHPRSLRSKVSPFDKKIQTTIEREASNLGISIKRGVYVWIKGPSYETAAEIQMFKKIGADAVGMSTVPEIYFANAAGMNVAAISLISNLGTGISPHKLSHEEVTETGNVVKNSFAKLMRNVLVQLDS